MKWSKFIQDDNKFLKDNSPPSRLNTSKSRISNSGRELALKSIEKAKGDSSVLLNKNMSTSSINQNDLKMKHLVSKLSYRPPKKEFIQEYESLPNFADARFKNGEWSDLQQIVDRFSRELSDFIKNFMDKIDAMRNAKEFREEVVKRIGSCTADIISKCIGQLPKLELRSSPIRKSFSCVENNMVVGLKEGSDKKKARVLMFKNEKVEEKNNFNRIESTFNQMNRILQNQRPPKFMRTSKMKRGDRSGDSSVEDVMERSLYDSRKSYKSRIKSKDVLYNINKILNQ